MEHLPQHRQWDSSGLTSFSSALSLLSPIVCQRSQGYTPELQTPVPCSLGARGSPQLWCVALPMTPTAQSISPAGMLGEMLAPCWGAEETARSQGSKNLPGHNANSPPISSLQILYSLALSSSAMAPHSPSSSSQANGLFGCGDSSTGTLGCAWEPLNGCVSRDF